MRPFWTSLYQHLGECGRNATIFLLALAGLFGLLTLVAIINANELLPYIVSALPMIGIFGVVRAATAIRRARVRRRERLPRPPLSRDELRVARSKLMKDRKAKHDSANYY